MSITVCAGARLGHPAWFPAQGEAGYTMAGQPGTRPAGSGTTLLGMTLLKMTLLKMTLLRTTLLKVIPLRMTLLGMTLLKRP